MPDDKSNDVDETEQETKEVKSTSSKSSSKSSSKKSSTPSGMVRLVRTARDFSHAVEGVHGDRYKYEAGDGELLVQEKDAAQIVARGGYDYADARDAE